MKINGNGVYTSVCWIRGAFWLGRAAPKVLGSDKNSKNTSQIQMLRHFEKKGEGCYHLRSDVHDLKGGTDDDRAW